MQEPSYLGKIVLVSLTNGIDQNNNTGFTQLLSNLTYTKYQYLTDITILVPVVRFLNTIIDVDC